PSPPTLTSAPAKPERCSIALASWGPRRLGDEAEDALDGFGDGGVDGGKLVALEGRQDVVGDVGLAVRPPDPDLHATNLLGTERFDDRTHAVVAAGAALHADADGSQRQVDVVVDQDQVGWPRIDAAQRLGDDRPADVHERLRLDEAERLAAPLAAR